MHNFIFSVNQTGPNDDPIRPGDFFDDTWFCRECADYVDNTDVDAAFARYQKNAVTRNGPIDGILFGKDEVGKYILVNSKEDYFESQFSTFKAAVARLSSPTLESFSGNDYEWVMRQLNDAYNQRFDDYVVLDDNIDEINTFDEFVRYADTDKKYYIDTILDYHY